MAASILVMGSRTHLGSLLVLLIMPSHGDPTSLPFTCCAGQFPVGTKGFVTCNFNTDLRVSAHTLIVSFYPLKSNQDTDIIRCAETSIGDPQCDIHEGYTYQMTSIHLKLTIPSVSQKHAGTYVCQAVPWPIPPLNCTLNVTDTPKTDGLITQTPDSQNQQKEITTVSKLEVPTADRSDDGKDDIISGLIVFIGILIVIILALGIYRICICIRKRKNWCYSGNCGMQCKPTSRDKDVYLEYGTNSLHCTGVLTDGKVPDLFPQSEAILCSIRSPLKADTDSLPSKVTTDGDDPVKIGMDHWSKKSEHLGAPLLTSSKVTDPNGMSRNVGIYPKLNG